MIQKEIHLTPCKECASLKALQIVAEERDVFRARLVQLAEAETIRHSRPAPSCLLVRARHVGDIAEASFGPTFALPLQL
jgi:hypothetical protein